MTPTLTAWQGQGEDGGSREDSSQIEAGPCIFSRGFTSILSTRGHGFAHCSACQCGGPAHDP